MKILIRTTGRTDVAKKCLFLVKTICVAILFLLERFIYSIGWLVGELEMGGS